MAERTRYKTKQKDQLTAYLRDRSGVHVTAAEIHNDFQNRGVALGMASGQMTWSTVSTVNVRNAGN